MGKKRGTSAVQEPTHRYRGANIPLSVIRRYARAVAAKFRPDKIILFGSYAYGTPHDDSDVDILVVMPCRNQLDQGFKIRCAVEVPFPMDLIVRKPEQMKWRLEEGESFLTEIVSKGKVLYEKDDRRVNAEGRSRLARGNKARSRDRSSV